MWLVPVSHGLLSIVTHTVLSALSVIPGGTQPLCRLLSEFATYLLTLASDVGGLGTQVPDGALSCVRGKLLLFNSHLYL